MALCKQAYVHVCSHYELPNQYSMITALFEFHHDENGNVTFWGKLYEIILWQNKLQSYLHKE